MIIVKRWGINFKDKGIFQSQPFKNWEVVSEILLPLDNPAMFEKVVEHHLSFQKFIRVPVPTVQ